MADEIDAPEAPEHHAPPHGGGGIKAKLGRRVGPLPVWGWGVIAGGGLVAFWLILHRGAGAGASSGVGAVLPADSGVGVGLGTSGGAGDTTGGGVIVTPPGTGGNGSPDPQWWNSATPTNPITRSGVGTFDPKNPFASEGSNPAAMDPQNVTDWLVGGSHYPGEVAAGAPPGYHLKPELINGPAYDPYDPNNYVADSAAVHDNSMSDSNPGAAVAVFVPPATIDGRPSTVAERKAAQAAAFPTQALGTS